MRQIDIDSARRRRRLKRDASSYRTEFGVCLREVLDQCRRGERDRKSAIVAVERFYARLANDYMNTPGARADRWKTYGPEDDLEVVRRAAKTDEAWEQLVSGSERP